MDYKFIEELSLNHWQPLSTLLYDGWVLRFADGYTKRANSVNPIYPSSGDWKTRIIACERMYAANGLPTIFKITPFVLPVHLDEALEAAGYAKVEPTSVRTVALDLVREPSLSSVTITEEVSSEWLDHYQRIGGVAAKNRSVLERMLSNIRSPKALITLHSGGEAVSCGLGVIEREYIGLYDIVTDPGRRNQGLAEQMILNLLAWGKRSGARHSYLAVVASNAPADKLYSKIGFTEAYSYWYRVKPNP